LLVMYTPKSSSLAVYMTDMHRLGLWTQTTRYQIFSFMNVDIATFCSLEGWYQLFGTACRSSPSSILKMRWRVLWKRRSRVHCRVTIRGNTIRIESNYTACFYTSVPTSKKIFGAAYILNSKRQERKLLRLYNDTGMNTGVFQMRFMQLRCR
jgi:hypothetical protein